MNENENDFEQLQELLRLKRHESPPPGYFRDFSSGVLARIRRDEARRPQGLWRRLAEPWSRPARLAWANALLLVGLGGVAFSLYYTSVSTPKGAEVVASQLSQYSGVGMAGVVPTPPANESILSVGLPIEVHIMPVRATTASETNPFPSGLFELPGNHSMRVGFGPGR